MSDDELGRTAGAIALLPILVKVVVLAFMVAAAVAIALGKIGAVIGGAGLAAFVLVALVSSIVKQRRLRRAIAESDRD